MDVTLEDTDTEILDIYWDSSNYNGNIPDTYPITGNLVLIDNVLNQSNITAHINIIVNELTCLPNHTEDDIVLFPNPANNHIRIKDNKITDIELYDITGKMIKHTNVADVNNQAKLDISSFPEGLYIIKITNRSEQHTFKLQVRH